MYLFLCSFYNYIYLLIARIKTVSTLKCFEVPREAPLIMDFCQCQSIYLHPTRWSIYT